MSNHESAEDFADRMASNQDVYKTKRLSNATVAVITKASTADNVQTFTTAGEKGWRLAMRVPHEDCETFVFVTNESVESQTDA